MRVAFAHVADYATVSQENKMSICGIFDFIAAATFPVQHAVLFYVFEVELHPAELGPPIAVRVQCRKEDGGVLFDATASLATPDVADPGIPVKIPQALRLQGLTFPAPGAYEFLVWLNNHLEEGAHRTIRLVARPVATTQ